MDATKLEVGPANVYIWEGATPAAVNVGYIDEDLEVSIASQTTDLTGAQAGTTPLNKVVTGVEVTIAFTFREMDLINWRRAIANAIAVADTGTPTDRRIDIAPRAGLSMRTLAKKLEIRPLIGGVETADDEKIIIAPLAAPSGDTVALSFGNTNQRGLRATFYCFPDPANGDRCLFIGDDTATGATF